jgi:hypothetical protein
MGRKPISATPMTTTERSRRRRLRGVSVGDQVQRIVRMFEAQSADARAAFVDWLRKNRFLK